MQLQEKERVFSGIVMKMKTLEIDHDDMQSKFYEKEKENQFCFENCRKLVSCL